ncbi:MAG: hypothetical protein DYH15_14995, partial [Nitrosomonas sp. PRO4]|nr:hypothetical protein [Nitrosomonas sp. PRO4]
MKKYLDVARRFFKRKPQQNESPLSHDEKAQLEWLIKMVGPFHPGHFYSPIPNPSEVEKDQDVIWGALSHEVEG